MGETQICYIHQLFPKYVLPGNTSHYSLAQVVIIYKSVYLEFLKQMKAICDILRKNNRFWLTLKWKRYAQNVHESKEEMISKTA
uniref:Bm13436 n=1 Tax=Brugia malayi TaxID=6279 RepID=A0A1I9G1M3_BRUMA|nr:Bm13436 [Brugia malayi]